MVAGLALAVEKRWRGCITAPNLQLLTIGCSAQRTDFENKIKN
jgi:hypothetical protein